MLQIVKRTARAEAVKRMKLDDMDAVADLAARRKELQDRREAFQGAGMLELATKRDRLSQPIATGYQEAADDENAVLLFAALRQAAADYFERELAAIEAELRQLGVEP